ncbi:MAG: hypothetical protein MMC23_001891 [Stictis urceolatum]|nr:hypothetical protein [Stictis urceolata]
MSSDYANSPTLFYPAHQLPFYPQDHIIQSPASQWTPASAVSVSSSYVAPSTGSQPKATRSRKRSRDDFDDSQESDASSSDPTSMEVIEEPVYGEGMTLITPSTGRSLTAESQTGTWYEENLEIERRAAEEAARSLEQDKLDAQERPSKTVRLDSPAAMTPEPQAPLAATPAPVIGEAARVLGIGWKAVSDDEILQCAARGWAKFIENHYPQLGGVEVVCKSEGLDAFLVTIRSPCEGWWLFKDDLSEGRLVASHFDACRANLTQQPMSFEGTESLFAVQSPKATPASAGETVVEGEKLGDAMVM